MDVQGAVHRCICSAVSYRRAVSRNEQDVSCDMEDEKGGKEAGGSDEPEMEQKHLDGKLRRKR